MGEVLLVQESVKKLKIRIEQDDDPESPREWDNVGKMICFHKRYDLGDSHDYKAQDYSGWDDMKDTFLREGLDGEPVAEIIPLYLYDHSGYTMRTYPFNCPWDSGQVGFIVATRKFVAERMGIRRLTQKSREKIRATLIGEVTTYDQYITGDVYGFIIEDEEGEMVDSCWGFYGHDHCLKEANARAQSLAKTR